MIWSDMNPHFESPYLNGQAPAVNPSWQTVTRESIRHQAWDVISAHSTGCEFYIFVNIQWKAIMRFCVYRIRHALQMLGSQQWTCESMIINRTDALTACRIIVTKLKMVLQEKKSASYLQSKSSNCNTANVNVFRISNTAGIQDCI